MRRPPFLRPWFLAALALAQPAAAADDDLVLGMSAAFSGSSRALGIELWRGTAAVFEQVNAAGGVHGRRLILRAYDDGYDPTRAIRNTIRLIEEDRAFALLNYVGTPTVTRVLPLIKNYGKDDIYLFFPFTGAEPQRRPPYSDFVFNLRASYHDETAGLVDLLVGARRQRIAMLFQADAYGRGGWEGVRQALRARGLDLVGEATYRRGTEFGASMAAQVDILLESQPDAIVSICAYSACAAFIRDLRASGSELPIAHLSFSGSEAIAGLLASVADENQAELFEHLVFSQVVPSYEDPGLPAVHGFREAMADFGPRLPDGLESDARPLKHSFAAFEGYLNARLMVAILESLGPQPKRADLRDAVERLGVFDLGTGATLRFGPQRHSGGDAVYFTTLVDGRFPPITDLNQWTSPVP